MWQVGRGVEAGGHGFFIYLFAGNIFIHRALTQGLSTGGPHASWFLWYCVTLYDAEHLPDIIKLDLLRPSASDSKFHCEHLFSLMNNVKSVTRTSLADKDVHENSNRNLILKSYPSKRSGNLSLMAKFILKITKYVYRLQ
jgi:hypothetical protein